MRINSVMMFFQRFVKLYDDVSVYSFEEGEREIGDILESATRFLSEDELDLLYHLVLTFQKCLFKQVLK